ncbi:MAG: hypothetical protein ACTMIR_03550 [Cellulomonadaceae bacterium]
MESEPDRAGASQVDAAEYLRRHDQTVARTAGYGPPRTVAWLTFWAALCYGAAASAVLFASAHAELAGQDFNALVILPPLFAFQQLLDGAKDRWGVRSRTTAIEWAFLVATMAVFLTVGWWAAPGAGYTGWLTIAVGVLFFVSLGVVPLLRALRHGEARGSDRGASRLSAQVMIVTVVAGALGGVLIGASIHAWLPVVIMIALVLAFASEVERGSRGGLSQAGYEWRAPQWSAFALLSVACVAVPVLAVYTTLVTSTVAWIAGAAVAGVMTIVALWPARPR